MIEVKLYSNQTNRLYKLVALVSFLFLMSCANVPNASVKLLDYDRYQFEKQVYSLSQLIDKIKADKENGQFKPDNIEIHCIPSSEQVSYMFRHAEIAMVAGVAVVEPSMFQNKVECAQ